MTDIEDLELTIIALQVYPIEPNIIKDMLKKLRNINKQLEKVSRVELPVKPTYETLQKRFDIYADAINRIDDFFEYQYEHLDKKQIKIVVMAVIDGIALKLSKSI